MNILTFTNREQCHYTKTPLIMFHTNSYLHMAFKRVVEWKFNSQKLETGHDNYGWGRLRQGVKFDGSNCIMTRKAIKRKKGKRRRMNLLHFWLPSKSGADSGVHVSRIASNQGMAISDRVLRLQHPKATGDHIIHGNILGNPTSSYYEIMDVNHTNNCYNFHQLHNLVNIFYYVIVR